MKVYLVGGAVRDQLLGYPVRERDWVVVGGTPQQMRQQGYQQVGRDFPVFLHPITREEYALARTERKSGQGYYGFDCNYNQNVTLEEDLLRRDLTINAMAQDENGKLVDPYRGQADLEAKLLRHVSPAFAEDPVRVLRVARFAARYHHLGFKLADETRALMYAMVKRGELKYLVAERVWQEWQRSLEEINPEVFIKILRECGALEVVLPEIEALFGVPNPKKYHPEVDSGVHSLMSLQAAAELSEDPTVRFAALVHDLGKAKTPMNEWPKHHEHEERGAEIIESLCERLRIPADYRKLAVLVARLHLNIHRLFELQPKTIVNIIEQTDAFRRPQRFENLLIACESDARGCGNSKIDYKQGPIWRYVFTECAKVTAQHLIEQGFHGQAIKEALHQRRVACAHLISNSWKKHERQ
ncbi:multifunctional CCA addition/repair protein [Legionella micdadei]|uniref:Multifunctional CCA protein n=1 Tax=Legionella micdadei TaxID=451 RepID=A0A098GI12_LEGMI|nr:multifunctional CCA addition/repair protein [Legionella micdadei]ARG96536.1 multifunctional CCA tRNA nucleotidyl transferase/2'3'-cyclic phosphodiesterase/2'nucleotidase/phosphatase [Legionella micdadei]KTD27394.1 tRNA nucleotidyltransferase [Legionella micdadei]NSL18817.1 multifunctional CCA addition/repair protein [Legionella micdadei]CEG62104.1 Multifunctional CCA protein [Includes: CCA-adding enzyme; 2'-nucleotidase; 2',3'-cyclic phosphodiesterase; Phosphatase] [Legionella micdadei]SCY7